MLSPETIDQIAAGEVILSPVSVVKELCENAIDAGADQVEISVIDGGKKKIIITDNGCGIRYNELPLAFQRHATSKISFAQDLNELKSLGFRGEALSSVAAVADVELVTRHADEEVGSRINFASGKMLGQRVAAWDEGTRITVCDLFRDVPARAKYMKKGSEEEKVIRDLVESLALSHPEVSFTYLSEEKKVFKTPGDGKLLSAASAVFGRNIARHLLPFHVENAPMVVEGLMGDLDLRRSSRNLQRFFINGRYVKNKKLSVAFEEAWEKMLMHHQHPAGIIQLTLPPKMLDVNIHPQKTEIRILNDSLAMLLFRQGLRDALRDLNLVSDPEILPEKKTPEAGREEEQILFESVGPSYDDRAGEPDTIHEEERLYKPSPVPVLSNEERNAGTAVPLFVDERSAQQNVEALEKEGRRIASLVSPEKNNEPGVKVETGSGLKKAERLREETEDQEEDESVIHPVQPDPYERLQDLIPESRHLNRPDFLKMKYIGQIFNTYLLLEDARQIFMIDQHAAHEAVMYETFRERFLKKDGFPSQALMLPASVTVTRQEGDLFEEVQDEIASFGFEAERFGEDRINVRAVPVILGIPQKPEMILPVTLLFSDGKEPKMGLEKIISMSCKAAVKGGEELSNQEVRKLLRNLMDLNNPYTCPHGRPVITRLRENELRKLFKRIV